MENEELKKEPAAAAKTENEVTQEISHGADPGNVPPQPDPDSQVEVPSDTSQSSADVQSQITDGKPEPVDDTPMWARELKSLVGTLVEHLDVYINQKNQHSRETFDRLYDEMRGYKEDFMMKAQRPIFSEIILLYDSIRSLKSYYEKNREVPLDRLLENLESFMTEATEILARRKILPIVEPGQYLVKETQKAVKVIQTEIADDDMLISERVKTGFTIGGKIFRREEVIIYQYSPPEKKETQ